MGSPIKPYQIAVPDSTLETLQKKFSLTTFPGETAFSNDWKYGTPVDDIRRIVKYWQEKYDWRKAEAELNKFPQFTTIVSVDGHEDSLGIHFVHQKGERPDSIPLLFCHGWAGSFLEVTKILPLLTSSDNDEKQTFHVVAPSLPNCGFSQRTSKPGFGVLQYAEVCHKLMLQLGYDKYVTQGGDWGFLITRAMGILYPSHVLASHLNFVLTLPPSPFSTPLLVLQYLTGRLTPAEKAGLERTQQFADKGSGYSHIHKSRPHTLGFALADSPVGLLAWIYEKLRDWTDDYSWTDEEVLTWVSIYLFSEAGPDASIRLYYEIENAPAPASGQMSGKMESFMKYNAIPLGLSYFPRDVVVLPSSWGRTLGPVAFERRHEEGGHFAAYEKPELLVDDLRKTVQNAEISLSRAG
ncbi:microsomal epoxide hydrolase [Lentithecium fluviatile CBS 122367]|uniref:Microsomal epoxide hydrolase n=1 Tax=Lentithecium fluviatile CBS 122367 TaxID=1168545 RepID=A0A6G1JG58_9PLEO|nr:microsomal epoxide hydrolase [Lentithecium fluviatile CBS 122367]